MLKKKESAWPKQKSTDGENNYMPREKTNQSFLILSQHVFIYMKGPSAFNPASWANKSLF